MPSYKILKNVHFVLHFTKKFSTISKNIKFSCCNQLSFVDSGDCYLPTRKFRKEIMQFRLFSSTFI